MRLTVKLAKIINIVLLIPITFINMICESPKLRYSAGVIYLSVLMIVCTWYVLTNRPVKKREKIEIICFYIIFILGIGYLVGKILK